VGFSAEGLEMRVLLCAGVKRIVNVVQVPRYCGCGLSMFRAFLMQIWYTSEEINFRKIRAFDPAWLYPRSLNLKAQTLSPESSTINLKVRCRFIAQIFFMKPFCKSQFQHKSFNLFFMKVITKDTLTD